MQIALSLSILVRRGLGSDNQMEQRMGLSTLPFLQLGDPTLDSAHHFAPASLD
jgi:hypothetical protein